MTRLVEVGGLERVDLTFDAHKYHMAARGCTKLQPHTACNVVCMQCIFTEDWSRPGSPMALLSIPSFLLELGRPGTGCESCRGHSLVAWPLAVRGLLSGSPLPPTFLSKMKQNLRWGRQPSLGSGARRPRNS